MKKKIFFRIFKNLFQSSYNNIQGMQKYLGGPEDPFPAKFHISGRFRPNNRSHHQNSKNLKNLKKSRFSSKKIDFFLRVYIDLYDGIWAEIGLQGCLKCFLSKIRYLHYFWTTFGKIEKNRFFAIFHLWVTQKWVDRIFYGSRKHDRMFSEPPK